MNKSTVTVDQLSSVVKQVTADPAFRAQLLANPSATLQSAGISQRDGSDDGQLNKWRHRYSRGEP